MFLTHDSCVDDYAARVFSVTFFPPIALIHVEHVHFGELINIISSRWRAHFTCPHGYLFL